MKTPKTKSQIANWKNETKLYLIDHNPTCIFCQESIYKPKFELLTDNIIDLAHKVRISESKTLECDLDNVGLAHRGCHYIFDNVPGEAVKLKGFYEIMAYIKKIKYDYYKRLVLNYSKNNIVIPITV